MVTCQVPKSRALVLLFSGLVGCGAFVQTDPETPKVEVDFELFVEAYGRSYQAGSEEYAVRKGIFERNVDAVREQNSRPGQTWQAGINALSDYTDQELNRLKGYRHQKTRRGQVSMIGSEASVTDDVPSTLPTESEAQTRPVNMSWRGVLNALDNVTDQGNCGSCWAISAATAMSARSQLYQNYRTFSVQQFVDCVPNPKHCGGKGGCSGATADMALDYAVEMGVISAEAWPTNAGSSSPLLSNPTGECPEELTMKDPGQVLHRRGRAAMGLYGSLKLPENRLAGLFQAVLAGPVSVSVGADADWFQYKEGIMPSCKKEAVVNHAVVLVGYGEEALKYWQIMNSWGVSWGEGGFGRFERHSDAEEEAWCGWDDDPQAGNGCDGGPAKVWVCGSCGILYDNAAPLFDSAPGSLWDKYSGNFTRIAQDQAGKHKIIGHIKSTVEKAIDEIRAIEEKQHIPVARQTQLFAKPFPVLPKLGTARPVDPAKAARIRALMR